MPSPVQLNDVLVFTMNDKLETTIKWSQNWSSRSEQYYAIATTNTTRDDVGVNLFVQKDMFDRIVNSNDYSKCSIFTIIYRERLIPRKKAHTWTVTDSFQYGQKNEAGDLRFVVLHDKSRKPYQRRFVETTFFSKAEGAAVMLAKNSRYGKIMWEGQAEMMVELSTQWIGDYLRDF